MSGAKEGTRGRHAGDLEVVAHDPDDLVPVVGRELVEAAQRARLERRWQRRGPPREHCDRHGPRLVLLCSVLFRAGARHGGGA